MKSVNLIRKNRRGSGHFFEKNNTPQQVNFRLQNDSIFDQDQLYNKLDLIKLNGSIDRVKEGLIFSSKEYGVASTLEPLWYRELAEDFYKYVFLFIGTKLNEPLFYHQIERFRIESNSVYSRSYVLTPSASEIEKESLSTINLEHVPGTLSDFASWLDKKFPNPYKPLDLALKRNPGLKSMLSFKTSAEREQYSELFDSITLVRRTELTKTISDRPLGKTREFYKGFKPTWGDILDEIPAVLNATTEFYELVKNSINQDHRLVILYGAGGTGKTTMMMQVALRVADNLNIPVFYIDTPVSDLNEIILQLEKTDNERYCIFYDKIDQATQDLKFILKKNSIKKGILIGSERQRRWESLKYDIMDFLDAQYGLKLIDDKDAQLILEKIEKFGPWTRLGKMKQYERINEFVNKAKRQLLIGLLEVTYGIGFEKIIENEFSQIESKEEKCLFMIIGFATFHRLPITNELISRTLNNLGVNARVQSLMPKMSGILYSSNENYYARHPVYVQHIFNEVLDIKSIYSVLHALINSYTVYESTSPKKIGKAKSLLFKVLINHKSIRFIFRSEAKYIIEFYESFEKAFEKFGLFWLQYGLSLRDLGQHPEALEKLQTAHQAHPQAHTAHALAQQQLIIACQIDSKIKANILLDEAKETLLRLDADAYKETLEDDYPIVTLSKFHCLIVSKHEGDKEGKILAREYANKIGIRLKTAETIQLRKTWLELVNYSTTGHWTNNDSIHNSF